MNLWHHHPGVRTGTQLTTGERWADIVRSKLGSWGFVFGFITAMIGWAGLNSLLHVGGRAGFDPYPYILLNLLLSTMAGLQGAILLISAKRADQISSEVALHTLQNTAELRDLITAGFAEQYELDVPTANYLTTDQMYLETLRHVQHGKTDALVEAGKE